MSGMNFKEYVTQVVERCESYRGTIDVQEGTLDMTPDEIRALHGALGIVTEAGELADAFKKNLFYGKPLDYVNLMEELGDIMFYVGVVCSATGLSMGKILEANKRKLLIRYPDKFEATKAIDRNLDAERKSLEDSHAEGNEA